MFVFCFLLFFKKLKIYIQKHIRLCRRVSDKNIFGPAENFSFEDFSIKKILYASKLIFSDWYWTFLIIKSFLFIPSSCLSDFRKNSETLVIVDARVSALTTFIFFTFLTCIYLLIVSIFLVCVFYVSPRENKCIHFYVHCAKNM